MKRRVFLLLLGALLMGISQANAADSLLKTVVHINFNDESKQGHGLGNIENILKDEPSAKIELVAHGEGISLLVKGSKHRDKIERLIKQKIGFAAFEHTMKKKGIRREELIPGVSTVSSGAVEVLRKQSSGYAYFKP